jgi:hypothetical protein
MCVCTAMCVYAYICICVCVCVYIYTYIYRQMQDLEIVVYNSCGFRRQISQNVKILLSHTRFDISLSNLVCDNVKSRVGMRNVKSRVEFQGTPSPDLFFDFGIHIANESAFGCRSAVHLGYHFRKELGVPPDSPGCWDDYLPCLEKRFTGTRGGHTLCGPHQMHQRQ